MRRGRKLPLYLALLFGILDSRVSFADVDPVDPANTNRALRALLSVANELIPPKSTCMGNYGQRGRPKVRDLVSMQLSYLYSGDNVIQGNCLSADCSINITHSSGEDVSSAEIRFRVSHEETKVDTLSCVITP